MLNGGPGSDVINGGDGSDILVYGVGDTLDGGDDNGDDLVRIDAIGASITTTNVGGDTFLNLSTVLTDSDYDSPNINDIAGLLIPHQPNFKAAAALAGTTFVDSKTTGVNTP